MGLPPFKQPVAVTAPMFVAAAAAKGDMEAEGIAVRDRKSELLLSIAAVAGAVLAHMMSAVIGSFDLVNMAFVLVTIYVHHRFTHLIDVTSKVNKPYITGFWIALFCTALVARQFLSGESQHVLLSVVFISGTLAALYQLVRAYRQAKFRWFDEVVMTLRKMPAERKAIYQQNINANAQRASSAFQAGRDDRDFDMRTPIALQTLTPEGQNQGEEEYSNMRVAIGLMLGKADGKGGTLRILPQQQE